MVRSPSLLTELHLSWRCRVLWRNDLYGVVVSNHQRRRAPGQVLEPSQSGENGLRDYTNPWGDSVTQDDVSLDQGANAPTNSETPTLDAYEAEVEVLHGIFDPWVLEPGVTPEDDVLWHEVEGGTAVAEQIGTLQAPIAKYRLEDDPLYIDGAPTPDDVQQGYIGDCYFLGAVCSVLQGTPSHIPDMISTSGNSFTAEFFRYDAASGDYLSTPITVTRELAQFTRSSPDRTFLQGANFRTDQEPEGSHWSAMTMGSSLAVFRDDHFEAAMWAPLLEKAYAGFAEQYGQYGGAPGMGGATAGPTQSGYEIIDGGFAQNTYPMFYGDDVGDIQLYDTAFTPGGDLVSENRATILDLLALSHNQDENADEATLVTLSSSKTVVVDRAEAQIDHLLNSQLVRAILGLAMPLAGFGMLVESLSDGTFELRAALIDFKSSMATWRTGGLATSTKSNDLVLAETSRGITNPGVYPVLHDEEAPEEYRELLELLLIVSNLSIDSGGGPRNVYAHHEYSVQGVDFRGHDGGALALDAATIDAQLGDLCGELSQVTLRNPHHANEPNPSADAALEANADGEFTMTLEQTLRAFTRVGRGVVDV
ncbi:MAG: hypothetical protein ACI8PZ_007473 [Myxococcota bacterium]|jgi:hypothetical protein